MKKKCNFYNVTLVKYSSKEYIKVGALSAIKEQNNNVTTKVYKTYIQLDIMFHE